MEVKNTQLQDFVKGYALGIVSGLALIVATPFIREVIANKHPCRTASYIERCLDPEEEYQIRMNEITTVPPYEETKYKGFLE